MGYKYSTLEEEFCRLVVEGRGQSDAYREAGYAVDNMKPATLHRRAKYMMDKAKIKARIAELRAPIMERHNVTVDSLMMELEQARLVALTALQASAAVAATMGKAKLCGLDKVIVEASLKVTDSGGNEW